MTLLEHLKEVMLDHRGPAHVNDIASMLETRAPRYCQTINDLPGRISQVLGADSKKKGVAASFSKVKNKTGGLKRGIYKLKRQAAVTPKPTVAPSVTTQFTGRAGEYAVISELLFYGFNACAMSVDDGIDVIASKDNNFFHVQVKTSNITDSGVFSASIKRTSFDAKNSSQMFYIFVLRQNDSSRYFNDYVILPSHQVRQLIETGTIKDGASLSVRIQKDSRGKYMINKKHDVTSSVNTFSQII